MANDDHHAGALLNSYLLNDSRIHDNATIKTGLLGAIRSLGARWVDGDEDDISLVMVPKLKSHGNSELSRLRPE